MVAKCPHCGCENAQDQGPCVECGQPLELPAQAGAEQLADDGVTRRVSSIVEPPFPRWGTASLGNERKLLLYVRDHDKPLVVKFNNRLVLGRFDSETGEMPEVDLEDYNGLGQGVSRRHAAIFLEDDALKVMDLGSANATYLNGQKLIAHQARILRDGDELRLGRLVIHVRFA